MGKKGLKRCSGFYGTIFKIFTSLFTSMKVLMLLSTTKNNLAKYRIQKSQILPSNLCTFALCLHAVTITEFYMPAWFLILWYKNLFLCLDQWSPTELSALAKMFYSCCAVSYVATNHMSLFSPWLRD